QDGLASSGFPRRRRPLRSAFRRLRRFALGFGRSHALTLRPAPETLGRGAQTAADAGLLRFGAFLLRVRFGFGAGVELAADELDLRDLGAVALAIADAQQPGVAARTRREARRDRVEQLGHDLAVLQILHDEATRVQRVAVRVAAGDAALGDRDQTFDER